MLQTFDNWRQDEEAFRLFISSTFLFCHMFLLFLRLVMFGVFSFLFMFFAALTMISECGFGLTVHVLTFREPPQSHPPSHTHSFTVGP